MANTIADKLERLEQTKQKLYEALLQKSPAPFTRDPFSGYPEILRNFIVLRDWGEIYGRNLLLTMDYGSGSLNISNISTSGSEIIVTLTGSGGYSTPNGYGGGVDVSGQIVIPIL